MSWRMAPALTKDWYLAYDAALAEAGGNACSLCKWYKENVEGHLEPVCTKIEGPRNTNWTYWFASNARHFLSDDDARKCGGRFWELRDAP